jgi:protein-tyrosine phosphatase
MSFLSNLFGGDKTPFNPIQVDMHCHLFPGIDDGVENHEESIKVIKGLQELGYRKFIVTPHIMSDFYKNTPEIIHEQVNKLRQIIKENKLEIEVEGAAEYYLDEGFEKLMADGKLLSFGKKYVLVETNYMEPMQNFRETIFNMKVAGYTPVLAHPERYLYMYGDFKKYEELIEFDILFQVNLSSLIGYYSGEAKMIAERLIKNKMVHFIGTDVHSTRHLAPLREAMKTKTFKNIANLDLLNNTLL